MLHHLKLVKTLFCILTDYIYSSCSREIDFTGRFPEKSFYIEQCGSNDLIEILCFTGAMNSCDLTVERRYAINLVKEKRSESIL